ncbi:MAG: hypothetical protein P4L53_28020 [Candidatus Obscuribacterales bacterium]|nr:hypothetical protein [Candidatus Obscuribacterales bacterium]
MRRILPGLAVAAFMLLGSGAAHATDDCLANYPNPINQVGSFVLTVQNDCTLPSITVTGGGIAVTSQNGQVTTGALSGEDGVQITAQTGITIASATSTASNGSVILQDYGGDTTVNGAITTTSGSIGIDGNNITTKGLISTATPGTPTPYGSVTVNGSNTVKINGAVTAGGFVAIQVPTTSAADTIAITGAVSAAQQATAMQSIFLMAGGNVSSGPITSYGGQITVHANVVATPTTSTTKFSTGASSVNGVNGAINANNTGSPAPTVGGIYITNGGNGGISIAAGANLTATSASAVPGSIIVDACNEVDDTTCTAPITIGSGTISTNGNATYPAGEQLYIAKTITVAGTTLTASDTAPAASHPQHFVVLAASTLTLNGTGLTINSTGPQPTSAPNAAAQINNQGADSASDNFGSVPIYLSSTALPTTPLTINGTGALVVNGNGANAHVSIQGAPLTFASGLGAVTLSANGSAALVELSTGTGSALAFNETAPVILNSNGPSTGGNAGAVAIYAGSLTQPVKPNVTINSTGVNTGNGGNITLFTGSGNLTLGTKVGEFLLVANGGATGGNGGTIDVNPNPGTVTMDSGNAVTASATGSNSNGGTVTINSSGFSVTSTLTGATINVNGKGTGNGGNITILGGTSVSVGTSAAGSLSLLATSTGTGAGGNIEVGYISTLSLGGTLSTAAGTGGTKSGGNINLHDMGSLNVATGTTINASGQGIGNGGNITLTGGLVTLTGTETIETNSSGAGSGGTLLVKNSTVGGMLTVGNGAVSLSANSTGTGNGGTIDIENVATVSFSGSVSVAAGKSAGSNGNGGTIKVNNGDSLSVGTTTFDASGQGNGNGGIVFFGSIFAAVDLSKASINASAGAIGSGKGGNFNELTGGNNTPIDVNTVIKVDGGSLLGQSDFDGAIAIQGVYCQQWKTGYTFPSAYWDCTQGGVQTSQNSQAQIPAAVIDGLPNLEGLLSGATPPVKVYAFAKATDFNAFWADTKNPLVGGSTFNGLSNGVNTAFTYTAPFEQGSIGGTSIVTYSSIQYYEVSGHETGHLVDLAFNLPSKGAPYKNYVLRDLAALDYLVLDATSHASTLRAPCGDEDAPFYGVVDLLNGHTICDGIVPDQTLNTTDWPGNPSNSYILFQLEVGFWGPSPPALAPYLDPNAQMFAITSHGNGGGNPTSARPMMDKVVLNGYLNCMQAWATAEIAGNNGPSPAPGLCATALPGWYLPNQIPALN